MNTVFTVSQLNKQVKLCLEQDFGEVMVSGEISNFSRPKSGHMYFSLKDEHAQLRCVFFRNYHNAFSNTLAEGVQVTVKGSLSVYEARGDYQMIARDISASGQGALILQYQALKEKLLKEGLFAEDLKRKLPLFPRIVAIITSPTGAALQDVITTLIKRYPLAQLQLYPSEVQGKDAIASLIKALKAAVSNTSIDVLLIARGGGSIEDLQAFNSEELARLIRQTPFPVISGIGHETDYTISDYAADYRAATPTAAAISATPDINEILQRLHKQMSHMRQSVHHSISKARWTLERFQQKIRAPDLYLHQLWQRLDNAYSQLLQILQLHIQKKQHRLTVLEGQIKGLHPKSIISAVSTKLMRLQQELIYLMNTKINSYTHRLSVSGATLHAVSPLATLERGYAITRLKNEIVYDSADIQLHDVVEVKLSKGTLICDVISKKS